MEVLDPLLDPWRSGIGRRALAEVVLLCAISGALGFWVIRYGLTYGAESLAHGLLPGLVLAAVAGLPLLLGAAAGAAVAVSLLAAAAGGRTGTDTATAVVVTGLVGLGGLLALVPDVPPRLGQLLFGDPLAATAADVGAAAVLAVTGAAALAALHRPLAAVAFDPAGSAAMGIDPRRTRLALLVLLAAAVCVGARGLGNLLVLAALVAPAVAVHRHASTPGRAMAAGAAVAVGGGVAGLYASHHLDLAAGGAIALCLCAAAALGSALPAGAGTSSPRRARRSPAGSRPSSA